jgi:phosphate transport system substrate-binding protein
MRQKLTKEKETVMKKVFTVLTAAALLISVNAMETMSARDYISIVGSSTVYPFATVVAEQFGKTTKFKTPTIESTGSGGGLKLFCAGVGVEHPDITNASRAIKSSESKPVLKTASKRSSRSRSAMTASLWPTANPRRS